jgi:hypothetical protein
MLVATRWTVLVFIAPPAAVTVERDSLSPVSAERKGGSRIITTVVQIPY